MAWFSAERVGRECMDGGAGEKRWVSGFRHESEGEAARELAKLNDSHSAMLAVDARLAAVIKGGAQPGDEADRLALAQRAYDSDRAPGR